MKTAFVLISALGLAVPSIAAAQEGKKPDAAAAAPAPTVSANAANDLKSGDTGKIRAALDEIRLAGKTNGGRYAPQIAELLAKGLTLDLTSAAIDTLGDLESEATSASIAPYAHHRTPKVRQAAIRALAKTKGKAAVTTLRAALSDSDPMVRGLAATSLGSLKAKEAVPDLFNALDHKVNEAAVSVGQLCGPAECENLASRVGKVPFDVVTSGLDQALFRSDLGEDNKIKIIGRLRELGTQEANRFLRDVTKRMVKEASPRLKQALEQAVAATGGGT
jgi:HEAT repeat protein